MIFAKTNVAALRIAPFAHHTLELPGPNPLKDAHSALDAVVIEAIGFNPKQDLLAQILTLNLDIASRIGRGGSATPPGMPPGFPEPEKLLTEDCVPPPATN